MSTLLLVDDNENIRHVFTEYLSFVGHTIFSVPDGRQCIKLLNSVHPDLVLLDIMMPGMDGWETLTTIKHNPATEHVPVVMCSGKLPDMIEIHLYGHYIEDYLVKPLELSKLSYSVEGIIQRSMDRKKMMERLKNEIPDNHCIDEFYACSKKLYIMEKFSRFFTSDYNKTESAIQHQKKRMSEIYDTLNLPGLLLSSKSPPGIPDGQNNAMFPGEVIIRKPAPLTGSLATGTNQENTTGRHHVT